MVIAIASHPAFTYLPTVTLIIGFEMHQTKSTIFMTLTTDLSDSPPGVIPDQAVTTMMTVMAVSPHRSGLLHLPTAVLGLDLVLRLVDR